MGTWRYSSKSATRAVREIYKQNVALLGILVAVSILFTLDLGTLLPGLITLVAGQKMWGNRFGNLTAIRFPIPTNLFGSTSPLTPALSPSAGERENRPQESAICSFSKNLPLASTWQTYGGSWKFSSGSWTRDTR